MSSIGLCAGTMESVRNLIINNSAYIPDIKKMVYSIPHIYSWKAWMNDFSKEELEEIVSKFQDTSGPLNMEGVFSLVKKIQSMIDNCRENEPMSSLGRLARTNEKLLFILGVTLPLVMKAKSETPQEEKMRNWILESIEAVVYRNEALPKMPE